MRPTLPWWITVQVFIAVFIFSYANQFIFAYAVPAGGDAAGHNVLVLEFLNGHFAQFFYYHAIWYIVTAALTLLTGLNSLTVMAWLAPMLLVATAGALYGFNRRAFGALAGIASVLLIGIFSYQPYQTLFDGGFPNVLAAGTVLPLILMAFLVALEKRKFYWWLLALAGFAVLTYSHHLTTIYSLAIIFVFLVIEMIAGLRRRGTNGWLILAGLAMILAGSFLGLVWLLNSPLTNSTKILFSQFVALSGQFPFLHLIGRLDNANAIWPLAIYPNAIGEAVVYLGLGGFVVALFHAVHRPQSRVGRASCLLVVWASILLIGSQIPSLSFPVRLARDAAIPLTLLAGLFIETIIDFIVSRRLPRIIGPVFLIVAVLLGWRTVPDRFTRAVNHNPLISHLAVDSAAAEYITNNLTLNSRIALLQDDIYLGYFTPLHRLQLIEDDRLVRSILDDNLTYDEVRPYDYIYLEERLDRPTDWHNNPGIIKNFMAAPFTKLLISFSQPQKRTYLFAITQPPKDPLSVSVLAPSAAK